MARVAALMLLFGGWGCSEAPAAAEVAAPTEDGSPAADATDAEVSEDLGPPDVPDEGSDLAEPDVPDVAEVVDVEDTPDVPEPPPTLCDPCATDDDCGEGSVCASWGDAGSFCAGPCGACPQGYECVSIGAGEGCLPASGECGCSEAATAAGLGTTCSTTNAHGTCEGLRTCGAGGLGPCDALVPAPEACGGGDEDCDGVTDEPDAEGCTVLYADADGDGFGVASDARCLCAPQAPWTVIKAGDCADDDEAVLPGQDESCNGKDDDCDGVTDPAGAPGCESWYFDGDGDGWGVAALSQCACGPEGDFSAAKPGDCAEQDPEVHPDQPCGPARCSFFVVSGGCPPGPCGTPAPSGPCPGGLTCLDDSACRETCAAPEHCQPGLYCAGGACVPKLADGQACGSDAQCQSGHCGGGFCCAGGACCDGAGATCDDGDPCTADVCDEGFACQHPPASGTCSEPGCDGLTFTSGGTCVAGECVTEVSACGGGNPCISYGCNPLVGCTQINRPFGASCGDLGCAGFELTQPRWCDGFGKCAQGGEQTACPNGFACNDQQDGCRTSCGDDAHCQPDTFCQAAQCVEKKPAGGACSGDHQCASGLCAGGQCCDGCCDTGASGLAGLPRAMEICGEQSYDFQGDPQCARVVFQLGAFTHLDHAPELDDTVMVQLSTGRAAATANQQTGENMGTSGPDPDGTAGIAHDLCGFTVTLEVPPGAKGFAFDFIFFSAEYPEWIDSEYNDTFNAMLSGSGYQTENVAFDAAGNPISINVAFFTICDGAGCTESADALAGTGYEGDVGGSTGWLTTTVPVTGGETITLRLVIYDEEDHIFDSDVLINNFRWLEVVSGTGPVTE